MEKRLGQCGWKGRSAAIVIDPELEAWVWTTSAHVAAALRGNRDVEGLKKWLIAERYATDESVKPSCPKEAMEKALRVAGKPRSSSVYADLASKVSFKRCTDPAFGKLKQTLHTWFGAAPQR
jgi:hypothetical protein